MKSNWYSKKHKNINYNQRDSFGITVLEKILNQENSDALDIVSDFDFVATNEIDDVYNNIANPIFKLKAKNLNIIRGK